MRSVDVLERGKEIILEHSLKYSDRRATSHQATAVDIVFNNPDSACVLAVEAFEKLKNLFSSMFRC